MGILSNKRHEIFAQEVAKGASNRDAYAAAGYSTANEAATDASASRLLSDVKVQARVAELQKGAAKRTEITVASITERLLKIADVAELTGIDKDPATGAVAKSSSKHLSVARASLMDAAKLNGLVVDKLDHGGVSVTVQRFTPEQPAARA